MRYIVLGIVFAFLASLIPRHSSSQIFGLVLGLLLAQLLSLKKRIATLEKFLLKIPEPSSISDQNKSNASRQEPLPGSEQDIQSPPDYRSDSKQKKDIPCCKEDQVIDSGKYPPSHSERHSEHIDAFKLQQEDISSQNRASYTGPENPRNLFSNNIKTVAGHLKTFFTTGNVVLKIGIIIIFFGVSFLLKYAAQKNLFPIEFRLTAVVAAAVTMLATGWSMRNRISRNYGLVLQGGGIGILYLTVFAASKLYNLLPGTLSLLIMIMLVALSGALAVIQDARSLAISGITGGFIAPVLMSTGSGSHVMLFSYYALLNCGILGIAWFKAWRELNLVGFTFTFIISVFWGSRYYKPEFFSTTEPFLILFFLFYVAISVLFAHRQPLNIKGFIDGPLVFGLPLVFFGLQSSMVHNMEYGLAITAILLGLFYVVLATILWQRLLEEMRMLTEAFIAMGVVFGTIAIPLALDSKWTSTAWALEGGAMVWVGTRQNRLLARLFGILLQFGAGVAFIFATSYLYGYLELAHYPVSRYTAFPSHSMIFINQFYLGCVFIAVAGLFSSYYMTCKRDKLRKWELFFYLPLLLWGLVWWFGGGFYEIYHNFFNHSQYNAFMLYSTVSCQLMSMIAVRLKWYQLFCSMMGFLPFMLCSLVLELFDLFGHSHIFANWGGVVWVAAFVVQYRLLWRYDQYLSDENFISCSYRTVDTFNSHYFYENTDRPGSVYRMFGKNSLETEKTSGGYLLVIYGVIKKMIPWWHIITMWLLIFIVSHETAWVVRQFLGTPDYSIIWSKISWGIMPALFILLLIQKGSLLKWPIVKHAGYYLNQGIFVPAICMVLWVLQSSFYHGDPAPLKYIPFLNPLELAQIFVLVVLSISALSFKASLCSPMLTGKISSEPTDRNLCSNRFEISFLRADVAIAILSILIFIWLNFVTARIIHFYFDVPFDYYDLNRAVVFQAAISILWGVISLCTTSWAARTARRKVWFCGAFLLALLVLKLFIVDLSGIKTIARIVSFLAVGGVMLIIGYISPLPPDGQKGA